MNTATIADYSALVKALGRLTRLLCICDMPSLCPFVTCIICLFWRTKIPTHTWYQYVIRRKKDTRRVHVSYKDVAVVTHNVYRTAPPPLLSVAWRGFCCVHDAVGSTESRSC